MILELESLRRVLGDTSEPYTWTTPDLEDWLADTDQPNVYLLAADILSAHYNQLLRGGAGTSIKTDDLSLNGYNNAILVRDQIKDLRARGEEIEAANITSLFVSFPEVW